MDPKSCWEDKERGAYPEGDSSGPHCSVKTPQGWRSSRMERGLELIPKEERGWRQRSRKAAGSSPVDVKSVCVWQARAGE